MRDTGGVTDPFAPPPSGPATPRRTELPLYGAPLTATRNGLGTAALVLGILSIVPLALLIVPAILAIVFGGVGRRRVRRGEATNGGAALAGIICGSIGLALGVVAIVGLTLLFTSTAGRDYRNCLNAASTNQAAQQLCQNRLRDGLLGR